MTQITLTDTSSANTNITAATQITLSDTSSADTNITAATQITPTDTSSAKTNITAATQITPTDTSSANTNITAATQITLTDTSSANTNTTAATQLTLSDTSSADTNISAATHITLTDTSSADTKITAATQICHTDTSSAHTNITAATQITLTDTSSADTNITAATQITPTDTSSANTNITAATQITPTDTSSANTNITAATNSQFDTLSGPLRTHSPLWRALRPSRKRLRTVATENAKLGEHSLTPRPPSETGTLATHSGKKQLRTNPDPQKWFPKTPRHGAWRDVQRLCGWFGPGGQVWAHGLVAQSSRCGHTVLPSHDLCAGAPEERSWYELKVHCYIIMLYLFDIVSIIIISFYVINSEISLQIPTFIIKMSTFLGLVLVGFPIDVSVFSCFAKYMIPPSTTSIPRSGPSWTQPPLALSDIRTGKT